MITENGGGTLHHTSFTHKARFYTSGIHLSQAKQVWICMHGYGHLATFFINKFGCISDRVSIIVPEGLHRFYLKDTNGRVGASWMTKEDRETDILNYYSYLDAIVESLRLGPDKSVVVLGFSQGAATAGRWVHHTLLPIEHLILWSGMFPPDVLLDKEGLEKSSLQIHSVMGTEDPFIGDERFESELERFRKSGVPIKEHRFSGKHEIPAEVLEEVYRKITI